MLSEIVTAGQNGQFRILQSIGKFAAGN